MPTLKDKYRDEVAAKLKDELGLSNPMQTPRVLKVVVNMGIGAADKDATKAHSEELAAITGQRPQLRKATKSISNFKLREGMTIGIKVTLRGNRMYEFLDRLINVALPRIRDFRGVSPDAFDGRGNYSLGIREQNIFPEIDPDKIGEIQGMDVTIVTSCQDNGQARTMLRMLGMPFSEKDKQNTGE